jgi:O-antigen ligase
MVDAGKLELRLSGAAQEDATAPSLAADGGDEHRKSLIFTGLCAVIALAPLPLGAGRPLAWEIMALAVGVLLLASATVSAEELRSFKSVLAVPAVLFGLVVAFILVQVAHFVPAEWQNPVWEVAADALPGGGSGSIGVDPPAALSDLLRLLAYAGIFVLSALLCRRAARALAAVAVVAFAGGAYATYGLVVYGLGNDRILWLKKWAYFGDLTGTFVNHNSFATYLGLSLLAGLAYLILLLQQIHFFGSWRDRLGAVIDGASRHPAVVVCLFVLPTALFLTHSRGGSLASLAGLAALALAVSQAPSLRRLKRLRVAALPLALVLAAFLISGDRLVERMVGASDDAQGRMAIYAVTWRAIGDHPILGTGLGSFEGIFSIYRTPDVSGHVDLAHDDYLQNLLELGAPAATALLLTLAWLVGICVRGLIIRRRDALYPALGIAASMLVAFHALVDFSLQIPAVTATYMFLLGAAVAQSRSTDEKSPTTPVNAGRPMLSSRRGTA